MYDFFFYTNLVLLAVLVFLSFKKAPGWFEGILMSMFSALFIVCLNFLASFGIIMFIAFTGFMFFLMMGMTLFLFVSVIFIYVRTMGFL